MSWYSLDSNNHLLLKLHVQPGARCTEAVGLHGGALKIKLAAPPVDGKANDLLLKFLAKRFAVPLKHVALKRGAQSRHKVVEVRHAACAPEILLSALKTDS
ncbi:DUF167 domain-containing protein [Nitrosomonas sp. ANs5]|uniref:DUF167 domain-containing protein n=1 Tax=Nitrosomonas sp. ANs5 TaxID=3423941 RepID=UPI003D34E248